MTDREPLELAAKAAGYKIADVETKDCLALIDENGYWGDEHYYWNPLTNDGDALRLAVKAGLAVIPYPIYTQPKIAVIAKIYKDSQSVYRDEEKQIEQVETYGSDPYAATRRAIVRAAAEIGKNL